jgi:hypothetical protein
MMQPIRLFFFVFSPSLLNDTHTHIVGCPAATEVCGGRWSWYYTWAGVGCDQLDNLIHLNLTALGITVNKNASLPLLDVVAAISNLTQLKSLVLSGIGLSGPLDSAEHPGLDTFQELQLLDISHNPSINGSLPSSWYSIAPLQAINISHTGITGSLPASYAALQQLREFHAANCTGITGSLPPAWGLLKLDVLEVTNSGLTGVLPSEWVDAASLQQAAEALQLPSKTTLQTRSSTSSITITAPREPSMVAMPGSAAPVAEKPVGAASAWAEPSLGMLRLRVLDLSTKALTRGGLTGTLPASYAALEQLQVMICPAVLCRRLGHLCAIGKPCQLSSFGKFSVQ